MIESVVLAGSFGVITSEREYVTAYDLVWTDEEGDVHRQLYSTERGAKKAARKHRGEVRIEPTQTYRVVNARGASDAEGDEGNEENVAKNKAGKATKSKSKNGKAKGDAPKAIAAPKALPAKFTGRAGKVTIATGNVFVVHDATNGETKCGKSTSAVSKTDAGKIAWVATTSAVTCGRCLKETNGKKAKAAKPTPIKAKGKKGGSRTAASKRAVAAASKK